MLSTPLTGGTRSAWLVRLLLTLGLCAAALVAVPDHARADGQSGGRSEAADRSPVADRDAQFAALIESAGIEGSVDVVVTVARPPSQAPSASSRAAFEREVAQGRASVLGALRGKSQVRGAPGAPVVELSATAEDLEALRRSPAVVAVSERISVEAEGTSSFGSTNGVQLPRWWHRNHIGLDWTTAQGYKGSGKRVVVVDSGVDATHPWLQGRVVQEACFSATGCPNGQTYQYGAGAAAPCRYSYSCAHGTHVAHIAAGQYGVAPSAGIVAINASYRNVDRYGNAVVNYSNADLINALWYAYYYVSPAPAAVNISIGGSVYAGACDNVDSTFTGWVNALAARGVPTVIAAGNDNSSTGTSWPGCVSSAVTVGNTTLTAAAGVDAVLGNVFPGGSNSSSLVDLLAPGTDICSAVPTYLDPGDGVGDGVDCGYYGTSMAAPQVAGAWALMREGRPGYTLAQTLAALQRRGTAVSDSRNGLVRTRINVANAIYYG